MKIILITGKPACGKDTQADFIAKKINAKRIVSSDVIDEFFNKTKSKYAIVQGVKFNIEKQKFLKANGKLVAYRLITSLLSEKLLEAIKRKQSIILSGSPRSFFEAKTYYELFKKHLKPGEYYFIHLNISDKTAIKRALGRARSKEDTLKIIKDRLSVYRKEVLPGLNYLSKNKSLTEINGEKSKKQIFQEILKKIKQ